MYSDIQSLTVMPNLREAYILKRVEIDGDLSLVNYYAVIPILTKSHNSVCDSFLLSSVFIFCVGA